MRYWYGLLLLAVVGCNRQDAECVSRIGRKVAAHTRRNTGDLGSKVDLGRLGSRKEPTVQDKILDRLRWENTLSEFTFEVTLKEKDVELKGTVKTPQHKLRAIELAETTIGVHGVIDAITVREPEEVAK